MYKLFYYSFHQIMNFNQNFVVSTEHHDCNVYTPWAVKVHVLFLG